MSARALTTSFLLFAVAAHAAEPQDGESRLLPSASFDARTPGLAAEVQAAKDRGAGGRALLGVGATAGGLSVLTLTAAGLLAVTAPYAAIAGTGVSVVDPTTGSRMVRDANGATSQAQVLAVVGVVSAMASLACLAVGAHLAGEANERTQELSASLEEQEAQHARVRAGELAAMRQRLFGSAPPAEAATPESAAATEPAAATNAVPAALSEPPLPPLPRKPLVPKTDAPLRNAP